MQALELMDIWQERNQLVRDYYVFSYRLMTYLHIDMILVSRGVDSFVSDPEIGIRHLSDHVPVGLKWRTMVQQNRSWNWWLNNFLLEIPGAADRIEQHIRDFFQWNRGSAMVLMVWEAFKAYICGIMIAINRHPDKSPVIRLGMRYCKEFIIWRRKMNN